MGGIKQIAFALPIFALIALLVFFAGVNLSKVNQAPQSIADDPSIKVYANELNATLATFKDDTDGIQNAINESHLTVSTSLLIIDAIGGVWKTMIHVPILIYNLTIGLVLEKLFGQQVSGLFIGVVSAILSLIIVFGVLALLSRANPDG